MYPFCRKMFASDCSMDASQVPPTAAAPSAEGAAAKAAAKLEAKANAKAAATAAQKAAAKKAAKRRRALAAAPNRRLGLFGAFTLHPRKKRSASFKRCLLQHIPQQGCP
jgi:hypothetical protein